MGILEGGRFFWVLVFSLSRKLGFFVLIVSIRRYLFIQICNTLIGNYYFFWALDRRFFLAVSFEARVSFFGTLGFWNSTFFAACFNRTLW
jgi:hypothetical protein